MNRFTISARRRIGREAADYLIQPMVSGVFGGVASKLSLKSCFPVMREMEDEYGSLFKAMIAKAKKARSEGKKSGGPSGPGGWLTSFHGGLNRMIEQFYAKYGDSIMSGNAVVALKRTGANFHLTLADGTEIVAKSVVLATPSYQAATIVSRLSIQLSESLKKIPYAPIAVVCTGYSCGPDQAEYQWLWVSGAVKREPADTWLHLDLFDIRQAGSRGESAVQDDGRRRRRPCVDRAFR